MTAASGARGRSVPVLRPSVTGGVTGAGHNQAPGDAVAPPPKPTKAALGGGAGGRSESLGAPGAP